MTKKLQFISYVNSYASKTAKIRKMWYYRHLDDVMVGSRPISKHAEWAKCAQFSSIPSLRSLSDRNAALRRLICGAHGDRWAYVLWHWGNARRGKAWAAMSPTIVCSSLVDRCLVLTSVCGRRLCGADGGWSTSARDRAVGVACRGVLISTPL